MTKFTTWPVFDQDAIDAVNRVLRSGKVNYWSGNEGKKFEQEFAEFSGCKYAVAVANGSLALELALLSLGIEKGDEVIVASRSFIASASCVVMLGAKPVFADVDHVSQNITAESIRAVLTPNTKAIVVVHLAGWPCDMDSIMDLAESHGIKVVEDCAQAHVAKYKGRPVGSLGHVGAFSFCQDKIMTTGGEGGMLTTNDDKIWEKAWSYKDHGKSYDAVFNKSHPPGYRWLHESFGTNWRLTEMQSAIGRVVLNKVTHWVEKRRSFAKILDECFSNISSLRVTIPPEEIYHSYYKYYVFVRPVKLKTGWDRNRIMMAISEKGVPCFNTYGGEVYLDKAFEYAGLMPEKRLPISKELGVTCLQFLVHPTLRDEDIKFTCEVVENVMHSCTIGS
ncbi:MAG: DegT/DnrJ/EryC1/StrS aminotransferase family protein [Deltaproteobacteria bacterium]|nr:DegT/DnrJ/EryC1/StrS aminotransferase family protein [Deltaproteobacteria bacterium]